MKTSKIFSPIVAILLMTPTIHGVVIQFPGEIRVEGVINGSSGVPNVRGDTLDYLKFEVLSTGDVTFTAGFGGSHLLQIAAFTGLEEGEFGYLGHPYRLRQTSSGEHDFFTGILEPGIYVSIMGMGENTSYDVFDGFTAVNPEGGGFSEGPYAYTITGDVQALEFWDGNLDGTFTITTIPEPSVVLMLLAGTCLLFVTQTRMRATIRGREH